MKGLPSIQKFIIRHKIKLSMSLLVVLLWIFCLPKTLFKEPTSTVITSSEGFLMGARIASDGQWRFPQVDSIPNRFKQSVLLFEDEYFFSHPGFNPVSIFNALVHNLTKDTRRGGSTITQQVIRLSRKNKSRTYFEKAVELFMATRLELRYSKDEILKLYATHTPYGGNVVGLETASWRYFGIPSHELSWGQAATLAVLPNAPSLIFPGRNDSSLLSKRNRLLKKLWKENHMDQTTYELAISEPLPKKPLPLPNLAPHLTERVKKEHPGKHIRTSVDMHIQRQLNILAENHYNRLKTNEIHNLSILILDVDTRQVLGYIGNAPTGKEHGHHVDVITKRRSTGSTLKPFLFASLLHEGQLLPNALVEDVPTVINGYNPKNFSKKHVGAVSASRALSRSLNVPAVRLLRSYGLQKFYNKLKKMGLGTLDRPSSYYGLSLILGGAESTLWDVTKTYASAASTLNHFTNNSSQYRTQEFTEPSYLLNTQIAFGDLQREAPILDAGALFHTFKSLREVNRPEGSENWRFFDSSQPIAWKTGTSFGFKDAWAVGVTPKYAIGVWAGNADGEGRPGLTGIEAAAPILFDVLDLLPNSGWFQKPFDELKTMTICQSSGHIASSFCTSTKETAIPKNGHKSSSCPYHQQHFLDASEKFRVNSSCYPLENMISTTWFVLPPMMEYFYTRSNPNYKTLPPFRSECNSDQSNPMAFIYPKKNEDILIPKDLGKNTTQVLFKLAHQQEDVRIHWYLDKTYVGSTENFHELILDIQTGEYLLSAVDDSGNRIQQKIRIRSASES